MPNIKFSSNLTNRFEVIQFFANINMAAGSHLGLRISTFLDHRLFPGAKRMIHTKFGAYRTNRFEVIQFLVNFSFFVGGHLGFLKMAVLTPPVSGRCQDEDLCQIW